MRKDSNLSTQTANNLLGILVAFTTALVVIGVQPKTWAVDLFWTGDAENATPVDAGSGTWIVDSDVVVWTDTTTSIANTSWTNGNNVGHFVGSNGGIVTVSGNIIAAGINFDPGANAFAIQVGIPAGTNAAISGNLLL